MSKVIIIAEAGVNHNGVIENAYTLIDKAAEAGVDYIKFQTFKAEKLASKVALKADYQMANTGQKQESQLEMLKKFELSEDEHRDLIRYCQQRNISFFSTAFDLDSLYFLKELGLDMVKIPSGEITNLPYLRLAAKLFEKVILSTGMCTMAEISDAVQVFEKGGISKANITILHCNTEYPTPMTDVNLLAMEAIRKEFNTAVGYSDHTLGIEIPIGAVALGATVIEKHFTLDKMMDGPDHTASLEPGELKEMVKGIRNMEKAISGTGIKLPSASELKNIVVARKSIVASRTIRKGEIFTEENLTAKRPGNGISPMLWDMIIGTVAIREFLEDEIITIK